MTRTTIAIDHEREEAVWDWGTGEYHLYAHRYPGAVPVYEYREPGGHFVRVPGFRTGLHMLWSRMIRETGIEGPKPLGTAQ